jgi:hypothetical protein
MREGEGRADALKKSIGLRMHREVGQVDRAVNIDPKRHQKVKFLA